MKKKFLVYILFACFFAYQTLYAQKNIKPHESSIEFIPSGIISYVPSGKEFLYGGEIHITRWFVEKWALGVSYSMKFKEHKVLSDIALLGSFDPVRFLSINAGPNFALPKKKLREKLLVGLYAEAEFNLRITEFFHFGILLGTVLSKETEISTGVHLGFEILTSKKYERE